MRFSSLRRCAAAIAVLLVLPLPALSVSDCGESAVAPTRIEVEAEAELVAAIWHWHEAPLAAYITLKAGEAVSLARFQDSVRFFSDLTGLQYEDWSDIGATPGPEVSIALQRWRTWFALHFNELRAAPPLRLKLV